MFEGTKTKNINKKVQEAVERGDRYLFLTVAYERNGVAAYDETGQAAVNELAEDGWRIVSTTLGLAVMERQS